jgi:hypothetical protein
LDIRLDPSRYEAKQTEEEFRSLVREGLQNPIKGFVDTGVPGVHIGLVGIQGGYSQSSW